MGGNEKKWEKMEIAVLANKIRGLAYLIRIWPNPFNRLGKAMLYRWAIPAIHYLSSLLEGSSIEL